MTPAYRYADIRGARLAWNQTGRGSTVIWAHGMSSSAYGQESAGQFDWRAISSGHRLVRYNARGHGRSTGGRTPEEYTWAELGKDLLALLDVVAPDEVVGAVGSSMGTATILYAALAQPDRFSKLVLTTAPTIWETRRAQTPIRISSAELVEREGLAALERLSVDVPASPALTQARRFITPITVRANTYASVLRGSAVSDLPPAEQLSALAVPTLLLSWTGDGTHPVSSGEHLAAALPDARLSVAATPAELHAWPQMVADFLG